MNLLVHFDFYGHLWCFESSQIALACSSCNFENYCESFKTSIMPINHEIHLHSYDFLYLLYFIWLVL